ncbi:MAG: SGNH/GDSL hydrolase family protein [Clostridia bacterium]|nr:SGNH/GDSL hydrolase family protein [Clostridia bacterium]
MNIAYLTPDHRDWWGERSIAVLGDSISFGVGCTGEIADNSYVGIVKKAVMSTIGSKNYGFTSAYPTCWTNPKAEEIMAWPTATGGPGVEGFPEGWLELDNGKALCSFVMTAYNEGATLTYRLRDGYEYAYACVYYHTCEGGGSFEVVSGDNAVCELGNDVPLVYDGQNTTDETKRTGFFRLADFKDGITLRIVSDGAPVAITGIGFYNDLSEDAVTFQAYCRGGVMLTSLSDTVLKQAASAGTLILGLGYNDATFGVNLGRTAADFTDRVDCLLAAVKHYGTHLIVNDYLWDNPQDVRNDEQKAMFVHCRNELMRLAKEAGGIYINQSEYGGDAMIAEVNNGDGVHPTNAGHALMAKPILEALGL